MRRLLMMTAVALAVASTARAQDTDDALPLTVGMRVGLTPTGTTQGWMASATAERRLGALAQLSLEVGWVQFGRDIRDFLPSGERGPATRLRSRGVVAMMSGGLRIPVDDDEQLVFVPAFGIGLSQLRYTPVDSTSRPSSGQAAASLTLTALVGDRWSVDYGWYTLGDIQRFAVRPTMLRFGFRW